MEVFPLPFFFKERFEAISNYEGNNVGILAMSAMGKGNCVFGSHLWNAAFFFFFPRNNTAFEMGRKLSIYSLEVV